MFSFLKDTGECPICSSTERGFLSYNIKGLGILCKKCYKNIDIPYHQLSRMDEDEIYRYFQKREDNKIDVLRYKETNRVDIGRAALSVDGDNKKWYYHESSIKNQDDLIKKNPQIYSFDDLIKYELMEDNGSIASGGVGRSIAGGLLAGGVGAIVGSNTRKYEGTVSNLRIRLSINDEYVQSKEISILEGEFKTTSLTYRIMKSVTSDLLGLLDYIVVNSENKEIDYGHKNNASDSIADELLKLRELVEQDIITEREFQIAKNKLINK